MAEGPVRGWGLQNKRETWTRRRGDRHGERGVNVRSRHGGDTSSSQRTRAWPGAPDAGRGLQRGPPLRLGGTSLPTPRSQASASGMETMVPEGPAARHGCLVTESTGNPCAGPFGASRGRCSLTDWSRRQRSSSPILLMCPVGEAFPNGVHGEGCEGVQVEKRREAHGRLCTAPPEPPGRGLSPEAAGAGGRCWLGVPMGLKGPGNVLSREARSTRGSGVRGSDACCWVSSGQPLRSGR